MSHVSLLGYVLLSKTDCLYVRKLAQCVMLKLSIRAMGNV